MTPPRHHSQTATTAELIDTLVAECRDPARLLELYYWSTEPGLLPIIRGFASLPRETRARLEQFLWPAEPAAASLEIEEKDRGRSARNGYGTTTSVSRRRIQRRA
jgi:hypothetical protein